MPGAPPPFRAGSLPSRYHGRLFSGW